MISNAKNIVVILRSCLDNLVATLIHMCCNILGEAVKMNTSIQTIVIKTDRIDGPTAKRSNETEGVHFILKTVVQLDR